MNPNLDALLAVTEKVMANSGAAPVQPPSSSSRYYCGVDLGTAYTVLVVLDENLQPVAGAYQFAQVVRDGLVVDFVGAVELLKKLKNKVEERLGVELVSASSGYPPGVPLAEVRATGHVLEAAGMECTGLIDEPTAANNVLQISDGAIVDVGGGTTGIAVFRDGKEIFTADEPTGGTHFSLVIAGAKDISFEDAEDVKKDPSHQQELFPVVRPVMEKVAAITQRFIAPYDVKTIYLVGGTPSFPGMSKVIQDFTGIPTILPPSPMFITPLGIALHHYHTIINSD